MGIDYDILDQMKSQHHPRPQDELTTNDDFGPLSRFYTTIDGFENGPAVIVLLTIGFLIFGSLTVFAIYNTVKFYRHRSHSLGVFYVFTIINLVLRTAYFLVAFFTESYYINAVLLVSPGACSLSIALSQIMNYVVLYIRLDSYASHRAIKGAEITDEELKKADKRERIATSIFTFLIIAYPIVMTICLSIYQTDFNGNVIQVWQTYEIFYMFNFIVVAILLVISTFGTLSHMRKVFGKQSIKEEKSIKFNLYLFSGSYALRVMFAIGLHYFQDKVARLFVNSNTIFTLCVLMLWITWDWIPICSMLVIHYRNFNSFSNDERLYTEYSCDDNNRDTMYQRYSITDLPGDITFKEEQRFLNETSGGVINLEEDSSSEDLSESEIDLEASPTNNNNYLNPSISIRKSTIKKSAKKQQQRRRRLSSDLSGVSKSMRNDKQSKLLKPHFSGKVPVSSSYDESSAAIPLNNTTSKATQKPARMQSVTVSANMLMWSLARSVKMGTFSKRIFTREIVKVTSRKSTFDIKPRLLIQPETEEYQKMAENNLRRSRSHTDIQASSSSSDGGDY